MHSEGDFPFTRWQRRELERISVQSFPTQPLSRRARYIKPSKSCSMQSKQIGKQGKWYIMLWASAEVISLNALMDVIRPPVEKVRSLLEACVSM